MAFIGDVVGFVLAWLDVLGLETALLVLGFGLFLYATRRRPGSQSGPSYPHPSAFDDYAAMGGGPG
jgi:hypothetical protein